MFGTSAAEKLTTYEAAKQQLDALYQQRVDAEDHRARTRVALQQVRQELESAKTTLSRLEGEITRTISPSDSQRAQLKAQQDAVRAVADRFTAAEKALAVAERRADTLLEQERALKAKIQAAPPAVTMKDLQNHRKEIDKAAAEVERLEKLIEGQTGIAATVDNGALTEAQARRRSVLADLAEGRATESDLATADKALAAAEKAFREASAQANRARETVEALQPRLEKAKERHQMLVTATPEITALYLRSQAEAAGAEYLKAAETLAARYTELAALESVLTRLPGHGNESLLAGAPLDIVGPRLAVTRSKTDAQGLLDLVDPVAIEAAAERERATLVKAGVSL